MVKIPTRLYIEYTQHTASDKIQQLGFKNFIFPRTYKNSYININIIIIYYIISTYLPN